MPDLVIQVKRLTPHAIVPAYAHPGDAGFDLHACHWRGPDNGDAGRVGAVAGSVTIWPRTTLLIWTGLAVALPEGWELQCRSRSGLAAKHGVLVLNSPGTIDAGFRGEMGVILHNTSERRFEVRHGDRIAQCVPAICHRASFEEVEDLPPSARGVGGFGSTGVGVR